MPNLLKATFPILRIAVELLVGVFLLVATPAALHNLLLDSPDLWELNASVFRISLLLALGLGFCKDALCVSMRLRIDEA